MDFMVKWAITGTTRAIFQVKVKDAVMENECNHACESGFARLHIAANKILGKAVWKSILRLN
jgi:hypothetical protein